KQASLSSVWTRSVQKSRAIAGACSLGQLLSAGARGGSTSRAEGSELTGFPEAVGASLPACASRALGWSRSGEEAVLAMMGGVAFSRHPERHPPETNTIAPHSSAVLRAVTRCLS